MPCKAGIFASILVKKYREHQGPLTPGCEDCKEECPHAVEAEKLSDYGFNRQDLPNPPGYAETLRRCE
jgi:hypothetical protein